MTWEPSDEDVQWLVNLLDMLKIGGIWIAPSYGVMFNKKDSNALTLRPPMLPTPEALEMIARTREVAEKAGIRILEPEAMPILPPTPFEEIADCYECEVCGAWIPRGEERRVKHKDQILCVKCAKAYPDDYFL